MDELWMNVYWVDQVKDGWRKACNQWMTERIEIWLLRNGIGIVISKIKCSYIFMPIMYVNICKKKCKCMSNANDNQKNK